MLSAKISREVKNIYGISTPPNDSLGRLEAISLFQIPTSMSQFSLRVIEVSSLVYPYFELDFEQNEIRKA